MLVGLRVGGTVQATLSQQLNSPVTRRGWKE